MLWVCSTNRVIVSSFIERALLLLFVFSLLILLLTIFVFAHDTNGPYSRADNLFYAYQVQGFAVKTLRHKHITHTHTYRHPDNNIAQGDSYNVIAVGRVLIVKIFCRIFFAV